MLIDFFQVEAREAEAEKKRKVEASKAAAEEQKPSVSEAAAAPTTATSAAASDADAAAVAAPPPLAQIPAQFTEPPPPLPPVSDTMVNIYKGTIINIILYFLQLSQCLCFQQHRQACDYSHPVSTIRSRGLAPCCRT